MPPLCVWGGDAGYTRRGFIVLVLLDEGSAAIAGIEFGKPTQKKAEASLARSMVVKRRASGRFVRER